MPMLKAALLNRRRLDRDGDLALDPLTAVCDLEVHDDVRPDGIIAAARGNEVLITKEVDVTADVMRQLAEDGVRLICEAGTGYNNLAVATARDAGIVVCNAPRYSTTGVAQLTMSLVLGIASGTLDSVWRTARDDYSDFTASPPPSFELTGKVLGIVGPGAIGQRVAERARSFDMRVLTSGRSERSWSDPGMRHVSREELFAASDFVSLHCPLRGGEDSTQGLINAEVLAGMKTSAWLVNTSRGGLIAEQALVDAVAGGVIAGAAMDVHASEPDEPSDKLKKSERIYLTPHVGWKPIESRRRLLGIVADAIRAFGAGAPQNVVS
ncbi:MAG: D-2-hydroxyacid dehydrogenase [bacterium]|nr:D-2-hydroxyacid dehydrogenase [bacterium]